MIDFTHDSARTSWADDGSDHGFPIQNLPYCVFVPEGENSARIGCGIGNVVLDVGQVARSGCLGELRHAIADTEILAAMRAESLNLLMGLSAAQRLTIRHALSELLDSETAIVQDDTNLRESAIYPLGNVTFRLPARIGDYTDFYASKDHATNVGLMFRPDNPLLPNYEWIPIGYHGRSSSVVVSGTDVRRPLGQVGGSESRAPKFQSSRTLDYELELAIWVGAGNGLGTRLAIDDTERECFFGIGLLNDWSARDIQRWEYQPLGPFCGKNFMTSVSPWIVTREALAPFRCPAWERSNDEPQPLPYLNSAGNAEQGGVSVRMEVLMQSAKMVASELPPMNISHSNTNRLYWTPAQMLTHHAGGGCNLQPGDLLGSGTVSGPEPENRGCLLERTWAGSRETPVPGSRRIPLELSSGEQREFLDDGDEVLIRGRCEADGFQSISLGECRGKIVPAIES